MTRVQIPLGFWQAALILKKIHRCWQYSIRIRPYTNPDHFFGLGVGYALNFALGQNRLLKLPALPFLVGTRLLDLFEQEDAFRQSCRSWKEALHAVQPIAIIERTPLGGYVAVYGSKGKRLLIRVQRLGLGTLGVGKEGFLLLMRIMDVIELVTLDSKHLQQLVDLGVKEGALNIPRCFNALNQKKGVLIQRLNNNKGAIDRMLKQMGARSTDADKVIAVAQTAIERLHEWTKAYEVIAQGVGALFKGRPPSKRPGPNWGFKVF